MRPSMNLSIRPSGRGLFAIRPPEKSLFGRSGGDCSLLFLSQTTPHEHIYNCRATVLKWPLEESLSLTGKFLLIPMPLMLCLVFSISFASLMINDGACNDSLSLCVRLIPSQGEDPLEGREYRREALDQPPSRKVERDHRTPLYHFYISPIEYSWWRV